MDKELKVAVDAKLRIPYRELHGIQGALKTMTKESFERLRKTLIEDGITFAFHVWKDPGTNLWMIIDGHGRHETIKRMVEVEGFICPDLPCAEIQAESYNTAKKLVLNSSSIYHQTTKQGLYEFITDLGMDPADLDAYDIPDIDLDEFRSEFYDQPVEPGEAQERTADDYANASIKPVILYYAAADYPKVIEAMDRLVAGREEVDYSTVVWEMLCEKLQLNQTPN